jgi:hypothetical protein
MQKTIVSIALVALLAGCSGGASSVPANSSNAPSAVLKAPRSGGPGTTSLTYYDTYAPVGQCHTGVLTIMVGGSYPATHLNFAAGDGPPLIVSNCNFTTPQYVKVTLGTPAYGSPYIRQTDYTVTVDAPAAAQVTATWTALGPTLPGSPGTSGQVSFTIGDPDTGGGL